MRCVKILIGTLANGGAERVVSNLSLNFSEEIDVEIILFGRNAKTEYPFSGKVTFLNQRVEHKNKLKYYFGIYKEINKIKKENSDAVFLSFLTGPNLLNLLTKKTKKTIISVRNYTSTKHQKISTKSLDYLVTRFLYNKADQVVAVSEVIKKDLVENYKIQESKVRVIYNSYDLEKISELAQEEIETNLEDIFEKPVIITVGRFTKQKGYNHLLRAFKRVRELNSQINPNLVFLGEGSLKSQLLELTRDLGLEAHVHYLGFVVNPFKYIFKSKIFVSSSLFEGFPNALAEAMVCGIPIISTDCPSGPREILAPLEVNELDIDYNAKRYGILLPAFDGIHYTSEDKLTTEETLMAEKIVEVLTNQTLNRELGELSRMRMENFCIKKIIKEWEEVIT